MYGRGSHDKLDRLRRLARAHRADAASLHAGGRAHRAVVPRLGRRAGRRADAARARVPGDRRRDLRRGFHADRADAASRSGSADLDRAATCKQLLARGLADERARGHRLPRRRPHGARHRGRVRLCRARVALVDFKPRDEAAFDDACRRALGEVRSTLGTLAQLRPVRRQRTSTRIAARVSVVPRARRAGRARRPPASSSKACRKCSTSSARRWRAPRSSPGPTPIIASTTSTILVDDLSGAVEHPERFLNAHWLNPAFLVPLVEVSPGTAHRSGRHRAREGAAGRRRQGAGRVRGAARLHRAAHPGARHERGRAHGRGRRRQRRGHRQGDQVRLRHPLRRARHARVHRLGRRRHPLLRQPLSHRRARQRALRRAGDRRAQHGARAASACATARAFSTTKGSMSRPIGASG